MSDRRKTKTKRPDRTANERKRRQLDREAMGRKPFTVEPRFSDLCEALRRFAPAVENGNGNVELAKAIRSIRLDAEGWEYDRKGLEAILTALVDEWAKRWKENITP